MQLKYAWAMSPIGEKSTPGLCVKMPPRTIGLPVAFLPLPRPQTLFVADAFPAPTFMVGRLAPVARAAVNANTAARQAAEATPILSLFDLIPSLLLPSSEELALRPRRAECRRVPRKRSCPDGSLPSSRSDRCWERSVQKGSQ